MYTKKGMKKRFISHVYMWILVACGVGGGGGGGIPADAYATPDGLDYYVTPDSLTYYATP